MLTVLLTFALCYFIGSIPFGLLFTRAAGQGDIREIGSGNIGATNVLRTGSKALAAATLLADALKGAAAVLLAVSFIPGRPVELGIAIFLSILGHCYPVWLRFQGGKGVATAIGISLAMMPLLGLLQCLTWLLTAFVFRISSLAALVAMGTSVIFAGIFSAPLHVWVALVPMIALIFWRHRENIARLREGSEGKINL